MQFFLNIDGFGQNGGSISKPTQAQLQWKSESSYSSTSPAREMPIGTALNCFSQTAMLQLSSVSLAGHVDE